MILTSVPNVSTPCVTANPCTCPVYGPNGAYLPVQTEAGWVCWLALETPAPAPAPVPALSEWGLAIVAVLLAVVAVRRLA